MLQFWCNARFLFLFWFFWHPFPIIPSFFLQILLWPPPVSALVSGRPPLWSSQHSTTPDPDASLAHGHGGDKQKNRQEGLLSISCSSVLYSRSVLLSSLSSPNSSNLPPGLGTKTVHLSLGAFFPSSKFSFSFAASVQSGSLNRGDTHSPICARKSVLITLIMKQIHVILCVCYFWWELDLRLGVESACSKCCTASSTFIMISLDPTFGC